MINPVFTDDFSIAVTDTGIYSHTDGTANDAGKYLLDRVDIFDTNKKMFKVLNNYLIFSYASIDSTTYSWKVQLNTIQNGSSTNFT